MENQADGIQVPKAADDAPSPSNSSNGGSPAFVGDVDERKSVEHVQSEKTENQVPIMAKEIDNQSDDDSFVIVDATMADGNVVDDEAAKKEFEEEAAEEERKKKEAEAAVEAEAKKKAEEERLRLEAEAKAAEAKKKAEEERKQKEIEAKKKAEEERLRLEAETKAAEAKKKAEEERKQKEIEAKKKEEEERKRMEAEAKKKAEEERKRIEAEAKRKAEEERKRIEAKKKAEAEAKRKAEEERKRIEAEAKKKAEEERKRIEAEAKRKVEEERKQKEIEAKKKAEEERKRIEAEAKKKAEEERKRIEAEAKLKAEAEAKKKAEMEAAAKKKAEMEAAAKKKAEMEAAAKRKADEEAAAKKKADEEAAAKKKAELEAAAKKKAEMEAAKRKAEMEAAAKKKAELEAAAKKKAEMEAAKRKAEMEAAAKKKADEEAAAKRKAEMEAAAKRKAEEEAAEAAKKTEGNDDDDDDLDLDALLDDSVGGKDEPDANHDVHEDGVSLLTDGSDKDNAGMDSFNLPEQFIIPKANEGDPDLDALLDDSEGANDDLAIPADILNIEQSLEKSLAEAVQDMAIDKPVEKNDDADALELDALLDDSEEGSHHVDFEMIDDTAKEDTTPVEVTSSSRTSSFDRGNVPNTSTRKTKTMPKPKDTALAKKKNTSTPLRKKTPVKKSMEEMLNISSISGTFSNSKKQMMTARDRMKEYSRELSSRASNQIKKSTITPKRVSETKGTPKPRFVSSASKRLFTSSIPTSATKKVEVEEKWKSLKSQWGENVNKAEFKNYMKATVAFKNNVVESRHVRQVKTALKETNAKKILVNMAPWKTKNTNRSTPSPSTSTQAVGARSGTASSIARVANTVLTRREKAYEREKEMKRRSPQFSTIARKTIASPLSVLASPPRSHLKTPKSPDECIVFSKEETFFSPARSLGGLTTGTLSSQCTVAAFVSPTKEGIAGCQNKYEPYLHRFRGPCELCVFRLSDAEKEKLDAQGRHLMVQFSTGGCRGCKAFPKDVGEMPVRLCQKCYSTSHRRIQTRRRKKGSGSHIGYSFAKMIAESEMR